MSIKEKIRKILRLRPSDEEMQRFMAEQAAIAELYIESRNLPGINERVNCPACIQNSTLKSMIQHINDYHKWTRERIADWLETLDIDLEFK